MTDLYNFQQRFNKKKILASTWIRTLELLAFWCRLVFEPDIHWRDSATFDQTPLLFTRLNHDWKSRGSDQQVNRSNSQNNSNLKKTPSSFIFHFEKVWLIEMEGIESKTNKVASTAAERDKPIFLFFKCCARCKSSCHFESSFLSAPENFFFFCEKSEKIGLEMFLIAFLTLHQTLKGFHKNFLMPDRREI